MTETPARWRPGDPIGRGVTYLPTRADRLAYAEACEAAKIDAAARAILNIPDLTTRRARIAMHPEKTRARLRARITEMWNEPR